MMKLDKKAPVGVNALAILRPNGGWSITDSDFDSIVYDKTCTPVTKAEFESAIVQVPQAIQDQDELDSAKKSAAEAKLAALGLTPDDLKALGLV
jgi:hypothetical protein